MGLDEALERTGKAYDKERLRPAPSDVVAQNIGYRSANNGAAAAALASLRYFGLLERPREGMLAVAKDYENYRFAPSDAIRKALLSKFLRTPSLFTELVDLYGNSFPSDANLKYELIQRGFLPGAASALVTVFKRSVECAGELREEDAAEAEVAPLQPAQAKALPPADAAPSTVSTAVPATSYGASDLGLSTADTAVAHDRIPVRLTGQRRAWLVVPDPFYEADKVRIKAQIDLLLTEDGED